MANSTQDFLFNTSAPRNGQTNDQTVKGNGPKKATIDFILAFSKSLEVVESNGSKSKSQAEIMLN